MNPKIKERMEEAAEHKHPAHEDGFKEGAQWMHDNEVVPLQTCRNNVVSTPVCMTGIFARSSP